MSDEKNIVIVNDSTRPNHTVPVAHDIINRGGQIRFYQNEESDTAFVHNTDVPTANPDPPLAIQNYVGFTSDLNSPQAYAANCMAVLMSAQNMLRKYLGDKLPRWAATDVLRVYPLAGQQLNAFYNRIALMFFYGVNPITNQVVHTCLSCDTVTHEFFHAVLDSLKPVLYNSPLIEQSATHEGFADCGSILHALTIDPILTFTAQQIDAAQVSTMASSIAPDLGYALNGAVGGLRDASVEFFYVKPETLPRMAPHGQLCREVHSFSRIWSSAFYACIMAVYAQVKAPGGIGTREALIVARDVMANALLQAVQIAPCTSQYMSSLANSVLTVMGASPYAAAVSAIFMKWGLTTVQASSIERTTIMNSDRELIVDGQNFLIREKHATITLANEVIVGLENNPLYLCKVEVPREEMLIAQSDGMAQMVDGSSDIEILDQVKLGLDYIWESDLVTMPGQPVKDHHVFKVDESGSLVRLGYNSDDGYFNNATLPGAPEFGKPWKPENNSGCCSGCKKDEEPPARPVKLGCYINERVCGSRKVRSCQVVRQKVC